jgi:hypothetical protein
MTPNPEGCCATLPLRQIRRADGGSRECCWAQPWGFGRSVVGMNVAAGQGGALV